MKAQMKAIMASAVVIALCLAAVGGVTYSWFSDSEESTINVDTAKVAIKTDYSESHSGTVTTYITTVDEIDTIHIENLSANCNSTITGTITDLSSIDVKYKVDAKINYPETAALNAYDKANIFLNYESLKTIGNSATIVPWIDLTDETKTFTINITTPSSYGGMPGESIYYDSDGEVVDSSTSGAQLWEPNEPRKFSISLKVVAVQGDYQEPISESVMNNRLTSGSASISSATPGVNGEPKVEESFGANNIVSNVTIELAGLSDGSTLSVESKQHSSTSGTFSVTSNTDALAVIEVDANGASFNSAQVIVDIKGMIPNPTVVFNGTGNQPTDIKSEYVIKDGETYTRIYFTTNHFSEYLILDKDSTLTVTTNDQISSALAKGLNIKLGEDINISGSLVPTDDITIDLNGHNLNVTTSGNTGAIVVDGVTVTITSSEENGTLTANEYGVYGKNNANIIVDSVKIVSEYACLSANNTTGNANYTITSCTLTSKQSEAIYMPSQKTVTIKNSTLNGGISARMGQFIIEDSTINGMTADQTTADSFDQNWSYTGSAWIGDAIYVWGGTYNSIDTTYGNSCNIVIKGNTTINGNAHRAIAVYEIANKYDQTININVENTVTINGDAVVDSSKDQNLKTVTINVEGVVLTPTTNNNE